ncbi:hypothetical protein GI374_15965 [Paracoccus sp. S-4012]|uniref:hypothetical protein n=1 Tax=Paracoccus sp. S-4012 TaxID=2665648 RepID=UPI0012B09F63|nr:hypothetical protein [Paracoccus sp. S-4012]MRX51887.1 hypothetical protein [Paracoccus sp. S-4012]
MQVAFHVGVRGAEDEGIRACLEANRAALAAHRVEISDNAVNEPILNEAIRALKGGVASPEMEEVVLDALVEGEDTRRLVMSRTTFLGIPRRAFAAEGLFGGAGKKLRGIADVLPGCRSEFFFAIRNPATLLPELAAREKQPPASGDLVERRWGPTLQGVVEALGGRRLVLWCNEDAPFVLPEAIRMIAGVPAEEPLKGDNAVLGRLLTQEGRKAWRQRARAIAPGDIAARRALVAELLAGHHDPETVRASIAMPGWDQGVVDDITAAYEADVAMIAALPGVEFLSP